MKKKIICLLTALSLLLSVSAAAFNDVTDPSTLVAVSALSSLDIINGFPDGGYHPNDLLTRAQFCKLAVLASGSAEVTASSYTYKTLFSDVTSKHWAAGYVNLAYTLSYINGYGDGTFGPESNVTYAQAVTILLRILGYTTSEIGSFWPDDYLNYAKYLGLDCNLGLSPNHSITRGEAAILLLQMMQTPQKSGTVFYAGYSAYYSPDAILLDNYCTSDDGTVGCAKFYLISAVTAKKTSTTSSSSSSDNSNSSSNDNTSTGDSSTDSASTINTSNTDTSSTGTETTGTGSTGTSTDTSGTGTTTPSGTIPNSVTNSIVSNGIISNAVTSNAGTVVYYTQSAPLSSSLVGSSGALMLSDKGEVVSFMPDDTSYSFVSGVLLSNSETSDAGVPSCAKIMTSDGSIRYYQRQSTISSSLVGQEGTLILNSSNYAYTFISNDTYSYTSTKSAILLDNSALSDEGYSGTAMFYIDGKVVYYDQAVKLSSSLVGCAGTIVTNESGEVVSFIENGTYYDIIDCTLLSTSAKSTSGDKNCAMVLVGSKVKYYAQSATISSSLVGCEGLLVVNENDYAIAFTATSDEASFKQLDEVYLITTNERSDNRSDTRAVLFDGSKLYTYPTTVSNLSETYGTAIICDGELVAFLEEGCETKSGTLSEEYSDSWVVLQSGRSYRAYSSTPVVYYDVVSDKYTLTDWMSHYSTLYQDSADVTVFFEDGDTVFILID